MISNTDNVRILQFGEGNFLRAFVDWMMDTDTVYVVKPRPGKGLEDLLSKGCRYDVRIQGITQGVKTDTVQHISSIAGALNPYEQPQDFLRLAELPALRFVVSNTTEAGIAFDPACQLGDQPALSYPGKLTQLLYHRWKHFQGAADKGLTILPCELIFHNATQLRRCIDQYIELWSLPAEFKAWIHQCCPLHNTLVDRIVSGRNEEGAVVAEPYHLWVIEAPETLREQLPLRPGQSFNLVFTGNEQPYHQRKVTLLNCPHTVMSALGTQMGLETVRECMQHPDLGPFLREMMSEELLPILLPAGFQSDELESYIAQVCDRFLNPFLHHRLVSIRLNAISKCKARLLPPIQRYFELRGQMPQRLVKGLLANIELEG